jgi:hypothetical protein
VFAGFHAYFSFIGPNVQSLVLMMLLTSTTCAAINNATRPAVICISSKQNGYKYIVKLPLTENAQKSLFIFVAIAQKADKSIDPRMSTVKGCQIELLFGS